MGKAQTASEKKLDRDEEGMIVLRGELFWKWKAIHEAVQRCDAEIKLRTPMIEALLEQQPELKKLIGERTAFVQQSVTMRVEYNAVLAALEKHFGFPMKNVSIDDVTGRVHRLEEGAPPVPLSNGVNGHASPKPQDAGFTKATKKPTKKRK